MTPELRKQIAELRAPPELQARLDALADKCTEGLLTDAERDEYETMVSTINLIGVLQAKAKNLSD